MKKTLIASALLVMLLSACNDQPAAEKTETKPVDAPAISALPEATADLKIYNWSDYVSPETVKAFEQAQGVTVSLDFYDSMEALLQYMQSGKVNHDLVGPSNHFVSRHIDLGEYQKINKSLIPNYKNINPQLLGFLQEVDPGNEYAVPYFWGVNTLAINKDKVAEALGGALPENEWDLLFKPEYTNKLQSCGISVLDSVSMVFPLALKYLGKNPNSQDQADLQAAANLVKSIRPDVRRFSSSGYIDDMANGSLCLTLGYGGDLNIAKSRAEQAGKGVNLEVLVPKSGFGVWIDTLMMPKNAVNVANAYHYINHTLDAKVAAQNGDFVTYAPASQDARALMKKEYADNRSIFPTDADLKNGFMYVALSPETEAKAEALWTDVKKRGE